MQLVLTIIYIIVASVFAIFTLYNMFKEKDVYTKIGAALLFVVLLLRIFLIK